MQLILKKLHFKFSIVFFWVDFQKQEETEEAPETGSATTTRNRYTKAQARQRFRKGKP